MIFGKSLNHAKRKALDKSQLCLAYKTFFIDLKQNLPFKLFLFFLSNGFKT